MMRSRLLFALLAALLGNACGDDDPSGPSVGEVAGIYEATALVFYEDDVERNLLQEGAFVDITLYDDGTTEGDLYVPALTGGAPLQANLNGTWEMEGDRITFHHPAATFIRDATFVWGGGGVLGTRFYTEDGVLDLALNRIGPPPSP